MEVKCIGGFIIRVSTNLKLSELTHDVSMYIPTCTCMGIHSRTHTRVPRAVNQSLHSWWFMQLARREVGHFSLESTLVWLFLLMKDMLSCNYSVISSKVKSLTGLCFMCCWNSSCQSTSDQVGTSFHTPFVRNKEELDILKSVRECREKNISQRGQR